MDSDLCLEKLTTNLELLAIVMVALGHVAVFGVAKVQALTGLERKTEIDLCGYTKPFLGIHSHH